MMDWRKLLELLRNRRAAAMIERAFYPNRRWRERGARKAACFAGIAALGLLYALRAGNVVHVLGWFVGGYFLLLSTLEFLSLRQPTHKEADAALATRLRTVPYYVLYLRSFDPVSLYLETPEELVLTQAFAPRLDVVAVAEPRLDLDAPVRHGRASRLAIGLEESWQQKVTSLMRGAELVIIRAFGSPGVLWEIAEAQRAISPDRLVLYISPSSCYDAIKHDCDPALLNPLPESQPRTSHFVEFDEHWNPRFVTSRISIATRGMYTLHGAHKIMRCELAPILKRLRLPVVPPIVNHPVISTLVLAVYCTLVVGGIAAITWMVWRFRRESR